MAVATGGAVGSLARWGLSMALPHQGAQWPWSTLLANLSGALLLGMLVAFVELRSPHRLVRPVLGIGVLGGWTTFSTWMTDAASMASAGAVLVAGAYLLVTLAGGLMAAAAGMLLVRRLHEARR